MGIYDELTRLDQESPTPAASKAPKSKRAKAVSHEGKKSDKHDSKQSSNRDSKQSSSQAHKQESQPKSMVEAIRKALKTYGKEQTTHRLTSEEKKALLDIVYTYKSRGIRTNENEIARIAVNFIVNDYRENGKNSLLDRTLGALNE